MSRRAGHRRVANFDGLLLVALQFADKTEFHVLLEVDCSGPYPVWERYSFHYRRPNGETIFRFDDAPHHLDLGTRHVVDAKLPTPREVAAAVRWHLEHPGQTWQP